jgi:hypothetical protein
MGFATRAIPAGGLGFACAVLLAACGSSGSLLSPDQASSLDSRLQALSGALGVRDCRQAAAAAQNFQNDVANLGSVDGTLVSNLDQGAETIAQLTARDCPVSTQPATTTTTKAKTTPTTTKTTPTTTTPTTTQTVTTPTTTTPTTPTQTTTSPATTTTTNSGGVGLGGGNGNGNGNGGGAATGG